MLLITLVSLLLSVAPSGNQELRVRFIGNSGFEFSDGEVTVLVDFPYKSGAYGYMTFDADELHSRRETVCLFTHRHADHFDPGELERVGCSVAGPAEVLSAVSQTLHLEGGPLWQFGQASIRCLQSEHGGVDHCSYVIRWHGRTILLSGDVEELEGILSEQDRIDTVLIPSWLASEAPRVLTKFPRARIVISHHRADEDISGCADCLVLSQGDSLGL